MGWRGSASTIPVLHAIGNPIRKATIEALGKGEMRFSQLLASCDLDYNHDTGYFCYHLSELINKRIVEKAGNTYRLTAFGQKIAEILSSLERECSSLLAERTQGGEVKMVTNDQETEWINSGCAQGEGDGGLKVWMMTDMEGVAGVLNFDDYAITGGRWHDLSRKLLTQEVNAAVDGAFEAGADEVLVVDGHWCGGVNIDELDIRARLLAGDLAQTPLPLGLDETFKAAFIVGQHAMAGMTLGHLSHTESHYDWKYEQRLIKNLWLNGKKHGELGIIAAMAGHFNVPTVLVTGDRWACLEGKALIPEIEAVAVKEGVSHSTSINVTPTEAKRLIKEGAKAALSKSARVKPYLLKSPIELRVEYAEGNKEFAEMMAQKPGISKIDTRTIKLEGADILEVLRKWWY